MKNTLLKIGAIVGAIFGIILLVFRGSNTKSKLDKDIKANKSELEDTSVAIKEATKKKAKIKKKVSVSKKKVVKTKANKKDTTSAKAKAKSFKKKYGAKK
jgi:uncharacterized membrane-anchored protein YhcB (DUF1043 family)